MATTKATVTFPDGTSYTRRTEAAYTHAAVRRFDLEAHRKVLAESAAHWTLDGDTRTARQFERALANLPASADDGFGYEVVSMHTRRDLAARAANKRRGTVLVLPVTLS